MKKIAMKKTAIILLIAVCMAFSSCNVLQGNSGMHTVTFNTDGGTAVEPQALETLTEAPKTTKEGYIFGGWFLDQELKDPVTYPMNVTKDSELYAKWIKATEQLVLEDAAVKFAVDNSYNYVATYNIVPKEIDVQALATQGYYIQVDVTYDVHYAKDYNVKFDLGYMGAPNHSVSIVDMDDKGEKLDSLPTTEEPKTESISSVVSASEILKTYLYLKLMTHNAQNVVYYSNITVKYTCLEKLA